VTVVGQAKRLHIGSTWKVLEHLEETSAFGTNERSFDRLSLLGDREGPFLFFSFLFLCFFTILPTNNFVP